MIMYKIKKGYYSDGIRFNIFREGKYWTLKDCLCNKNRKYLKYKKDAIEIMQKWKGGHKYF